MMRFRMVALAISALISALVVIGVASYQVSGIDDFFEATKSISIVKKDKPPPPPPPPPPPTDRPPPPPIVQRATPPVFSAPPVETELPVMKEPPPPTPAPPSPPPPPVVTEAVRMGKTIEPEYPERAIERDKSGVVRLRLVIATDGSVSDVQVIEEDPTGFGFGRAAIAAARRQKFQPRMRDGSPIEGEFTFTYRFRLQ